MLARVWETRLDMATRPYPGNHPVQGTEIVPAAVLLNTFRTAAKTDVAEVQLRTPVAPGRTRDVQVVLQDQALAIATRLVDDGPDVGGWLTHCTSRSPPPATIARCPGSTSPRSGYGAPSS